MVCVIDGSHSSASDASIRMYTLLKHWAPVPDDAELIFNAYRDGIGAIVGKEYVTHDDLGWVMAEIVDEMMSDARVHCFIDDNSLYVRETDLAD